MKKCILKSKAHRAVANAKQEQRYCNVPEMEQVEQKIFEVLTQPNVELTKHKKLLNYVYQHKEKYIKRIYATFVRGLEPEVFSLYNKYPFAFDSIGYCHVRIKMYDFGEFGETINAFIPPDVFRLRCFMFYYLVFRYVIEDCKGLADAIEILRCFVDNAADAEYFSIKLYGLYSIDTIFSMFALCNNIDTENSNPLFPLDE